MCTDTQRPEQDYHARLCPRGPDVLDTYGVSICRNFFLIDSVTQVDFN